MPRHYPRRCLHHRHCPHRQSGPPPLLLPFPLFLGPDPKGPPLRPPPRRRTATAPTQPAAPPSPGGRRRRTAPPRPQSPHSLHPRLRSILRTCAQLPPPRRGQHRIERVLEEQRHDHYRNAQPPELERCPPGHLEEEGRRVVPLRNCLAAPSAWPAPPRMATLHKACSTPTSLPPPPPPPR